MNQSVRQFLNSRLWAVISSIGIFLGVAVFFLVAYSCVSQYTGRQKFVALFQEANPNAKVVVDAKQYAKSDPQDIFRGAYILLFRSDEATMKAFLKKRDFTGGATGSIDNHFQGQFKQFEERDLTDPAGGYYRPLLHKQLSSYSCPGDLFDNNSFATTYLYWDAQTSTGMFYVHWSD